MAAQADGTRAELAGRDKAAILLLSLGPEVSSQVLRHMSDGEIEQLTVSIATPPVVVEQTRAEVIQEFGQLLQARSYAARGGLAYAQDLLERALGASRALEIMHRLTTAMRSRPFEVARRTNPHQLLTFLEGEQPQTIALVLSYLTSDQAATVLKSLPPDLQTEVAGRVAMMDPTGPDVVREVEQVLDSHIASLVTKDYSTPGGVDVVVNMLNRVDRGTERSIMQALEQQDAELAEEIRKRMFLFEDIARLDDRSIQRVIRETDPHDLTLALKGASEAIGQRFLANMSQRMAETVSEELKFLGPVRLREVEEAQGRVVAAVRRLEEAGEIVVSRGGDDDVLI
jgi:flagellar motor switch protein FliG